MKVKKILAAAMAMVVVGGTVSIELPKTVNMEITAYAADGEDLVIPSGLKAIGNSAYEGNTKITSVTIPDSVASIGDSAFKDCTNLTKVTIPDSVTTIGAYAFAGCTSLTEIVIPDSVTSIDRNAFDGCKNLVSIKLSENLANVSLEAFQNCSSLKEITIPASVKEIHGEAFYGCSSLDNITILNPNCYISTDYKVYDGYRYYGKDIIPERTTIWGYDESTAEVYADAFGRGFGVLPDPEPVTTTAVTTTATEPTTTTSTTTTTTTTTEPEKPLNLGDVNGDGLIDANDASITLDAYLQKEISDKYNLANADANQNGVVEAADASAILSYYSYVITSWDSDWVSFSEYIAKEGFDNTISETADGGFTDEQIENSEIKPSINISKVELPLNRMTGQTLSVNVTLEGADMNWSTSGIHIFYDNRLEIVTDRIERPVTFGKASTYLSTNSTAIVSSDSSMNEIFIATMRHKNEGQDGTLCTINFKIPSDAAIGDEFKIEVRYVPGSMFTNTKNDEQGRLMQAYLFTQGLNSGYIKVIGDTTTTLPTTTSTTTTTTTSKSTTTTSTTAKTTTSAPTTTSTTPNTPKPVYTLGDVDENGIIDASDASLVLTAYAQFSTGSEVEFTEEQLLAADVNSDGIVDATDASNILAYYAYVSTGGNGSFENFLGIEQPSDSWKEAYFEVVEANDFRENNTYSLVYIDDDDIPELVISDYGDYRQGGIYTYKNGEAHYLTYLTLRTFLSGYKEREGVFVISWYWLADKGYQLYKLEGDSITLLESIETSQVEPQTYTVNGNTATEEEYNKKAEEYEAYPLNITRYSYDEIKTQLS